MKQFEIVLPTRLGQEEFDRVYNIMLDKCKVGYVMYAKHPKDEMASFEHWHIGGQCKSDNTPETIAKWFGYQPNQIERIKSHFATYSTYLAHKTKDAVESGKGEPLEIGGTYDFKKAISSYETKGKTDTIISDVLAGKITEYDLNCDTELMNAIISQGLYNKVKQALNTYQNAESVRRMNGEKSVQVGWICGFAGSGKTTLAKSMAQGKPYYITSAGSNPFDNYLGQPVVIIDDIDRNTASGKTLLKLLDPHTDTLTACRYNNRLITADLILVTSTVTPDKWWLDNASDSDGNKYQLLRRLTLGTWMLGDGQGQISTIIYDGSGKEIVRQTADFPRDIIEKRALDTARLRVDNVKTMFSALGVSVSMDKVDMDFSGFKDMNQLEMADLGFDIPFTDDKDKKTGKSTTSKRKTARKSK